MLILVPFLVGFGFGMILATLYIAAQVSIIITDQGNGGTFCSNCGHDLDKGNPNTKIPKTCPKCGAKFTGMDTYINSGGSDF